MRLAYLLFACGIVALGVVHMAATFRSFDAPSSAALWFFSGGIAMVLTGVLNLLNRASAVSRQAVVSFLLVRTLS